MYTQRSGSPYAGAREPAREVCLKEVARRISLCLLMTLAGGVAVWGQPAIQPTVDITRVPDAAQPSAQFNADAATDAYMAMMPPEAIARSNAYFEGGYWLILWDFLVALAVAWLYLGTGLSRRIRDWTERTS